MCHKIGGRACNQRGAIRNNYGDEQQFASSVFQVGDTHGDIGEDHQWYDKG